MSRIIQKWTVYCNTEADYVTGYLVSTGLDPTDCFHNNTHTIDISKSKLLETIYDSHTRQLYEWSVYCDTEHIFVSAFTNNDIYPEQCPNNDTHIVSKIPTLIHCIFNNNTRIVEESRVTGGNFQCVSYKMVCPVGESNHDFTFDYPISALSITLNTIADNTDDNIEVIVGPDTLVGSITSDVSASDTVINVSQTVIDNAKIGFFANITDGTNTDNLGKITAINPINSTITVNSVATQSFLAATPTYVRLSVNVIDNYTIGPPGRYEIGKDKIGGSYVDTNRVIRVKYTNNGGSSVNFYAMIDILY